MTSSDAPAAAAAAAAAADAAVAAAAASGSSVSPRASAAPAAAVTTTTTSPPPSVSASASALSSHGAPPPPPPPPPPPALQDPFVEVNDAPGPAQQPRSPLQSPLQSQSQLPLPLQSQSPPPPQLPPPHSPPSPQAHNQQQQQQQQQQQPLPYELHLPQLNEHFIPSPPTVSPLSTPAITPALRSTNGDHAGEDDLPKLSETPHDLAVASTSTAPPLPLDDMETLKSGLAMGLGRLEALGMPLYPQDSQAQNRGCAAVATTDDDAYSLQAQADLRMLSRHASINSVEPSAYLLSTAQGNPVSLPGDYPMAVAPSDISLQASFAQDSDAMMANADVASASLSAGASQKLESFARIEFADSVFQMTTYAVIIGRDHKAMLQARRDESREVKHRRRVEENQRHGLPPPTPIGKDWGKFSKSYVSEEGGMLGPESDDEDDGGGHRAKHTKPSSGGVPQHGGGNDEQGETAKSNLQYVSHTEGAAAVDLSTIQPSVSHIPFIGIHSPGPDIATKTRAISRQHLKIQFNEKKGVFEAISLHRNGFFCEDVFYGENEPFTIRSGDRLQIKDVAFHFVINGVEPGKTGGEEYEEETSSKHYSAGGKEMSFDFEHSDHEKFHDTSDELSELEHIPTPPAMSEDGMEELPDVTALETNHEIALPEHDGDIIMQSAETAMDFDIEAPIEPSLEATMNATLDATMDATMEAPMNTGMDASLEASLEASMEAPMAPEMPHTLDHGMDLNLPPEMMIPQLPKRRGPGRPPKDGIMSKRERRLIKKAMMEESKKTLPLDQPQGERIKRPVGRPRKNPLPENGERPEKRKYNKRKKEDGEEGSDAEKRKEKKDKKVRPKSPPLALDRADFTEEQLQKPSKNYGVLIDEALTNGPPDGLTLKQIYKRITVRYPWFYFLAETKGWESSVRHNLIGNEAFKKDDQTGLWSRVPGVELDAGKKRKAVSPDRQLGAASTMPQHHMGHQQPYYHGGGYMQQGGMHYAPGLQGASYPNGAHSHAGYQAPPAHNNQTHPANPQAQPQAQSQSSGQQSYPTQSSASASVQGATGYNPTLMRQQSTGQQHQQHSTYGSPYSRPPPPAAVHTGHADSSAAGHATTSASQATSFTVPNPQPPRPPATNGNATPVPMTPEVERAIAEWKKNMIGAISKSTDTTKAVQIIDTAINRTLGLPTSAAQPAFEQIETTLVHALQRTIRDAQARQGSAASASPASGAPATPASSAAPQSTPVPAAPQPTAVPAAPQQTAAPPAAAPIPIDNALRQKIRAFRDSMVTGLANKIDNVEAVVDAAVNRAQGLTSEPAVHYRDVDRMIVQRVIKLINEARHPPQPTSPAAQVARPSQETPAHQGPSAPAAVAQPCTPAPPVDSSQPAARRSSASQSSPPPATAGSAMTPRPPIATPSKPGISIARPSPMGFTRPGAVSVARPSVAAKNPPSAMAAPAASAALSAVTNATTPTSAASVKTAIPNVSSGPPSPFVRAPAPVSTAATAPVTNATAPSAATANLSVPGTSGAGHAVGSLGSTKPVSPAPAPTPTTTPSAGAIEQITGRKRTLENTDGSGADGRDLKRRAISPPPAAAGSTISNAVSSTAQTNTPQPPGLPSAIAAQRSASQPTRNPPSNTAQANPFYPGIRLPAITPQASPSQPAPGPSSSTAQANPPPPASKPPPNVEQTKPPQPALPVIETSPPKAPQPASHPAVTASQHNSLQPASKAPVGSVQTNPPQPASKPPAGSVQTNPPQPAVAVPAPGPSPPKAPQPASNPPTSTGQGQGQGQGSPQQPASNPAAGTAQVNSAQPAVPVTGSSPPKAPTPLPTAAQPPPPPPRPDTPSHQPQPAASQPTPMPS